MEQTSNELQKLTIQTANTPSQVPQHDRNGSDLILNYKFSDEESKAGDAIEEDDDSPQVDMSFISDVFHLLPFVLALFTLTGESTDFLLQRVQ